MVATNGQIAMVKDDPCESIDCLEPYFQGVDLVITEGYKKENKPKIEVIRKLRGDSSVCGKNDHLIGVVTDTDIDLSVPKFGFDDINKLVDFIEKNLL